MGTLRPRRVGQLLLATLLGATACGAGPGPSQGTTDKPVTGVCASYDVRLDDALAHVCTRGGIRVATDPANRPRSWYVADKGEWRGFDVDVATEIATRLGVRPDFQSRDPVSDPQGSWNDRYDMTVASIVITDAGEDHVAFTPPYVYTPGSVVVHAGNTDLRNVATDLDGKRICVARQSPYERYLQGDLSLPTAPPFEFVIDDAQIVEEDSDESALADLATGDGVRCDAALVGLPDADAFVQEGEPVKTIGDPLFYEPMGIGFDKRDPVDNASLVLAVSKIVEDMRDDDTLSGLSIRDLGVDLTVTNPSPVNGG